MKYTIVIPTYNNCSKYLKPCIDSIIKYTDLSEIELVIVYNGCTDETKYYVNYLIHYFDYHGYGHHLRFYGSNEPLGFAKAINHGIKLATTNKIVLLNNDTVLLDQPKNQWLERLNQGDICSVLTDYSEITKSRFGVFFCVMIDRKVFDAIGLLDEDFETGGCEDIDFCFKAQAKGFETIDVGWRGDFPIYHAAEGTMNDHGLVKQWDLQFLKNQLRLAKKYNREWYYWRLSNNYERAVFLKGDPVLPREATRYLWANRNLLGKNILEIGCSTGYGSQFLPNNINYIGLDYDPIIIGVAHEQEWGLNASFSLADINTYPLAQYDTIIAFELIEHLDNGLEIAQKLKNHCKRLLLTTPHNEPVGFWGEHHKLHGLNESHFNGFKFHYIDEFGAITETRKPIYEGNKFSLMI